jgi:IS1 family transposase
VLLQGLQKILHALPENARNPTGNEINGDKDVSGGDKRKESRSDIWFFKGECAELDKKKLHKKGFVSLAFNAHTFDGAYEMDELYWYIGEKPRTETHENVYLMTIVSREPRQIQSYCVARDKCAWRIQEMVDRIPKAKTYCSDGYLGYLDVDYYGAKYVRNCRNKADTHHVESINADIRCFIAGLQRRSRCFFRSLETLEAVIDIFVEAYNAFGAWKMKYRRQVHHRPGNQGKHLHNWNYSGASIFNFVVI